MVDTRGPRLSGKIALVTGSTRGLGRTIVDWLAREGADVVVHGRDESDVAAVCAEVEQLGVTATGFHADLSSIAETHGLAEGVLNAVDRIDILVNNAGMSFRESFWDVSDDSWEYQTNVNYRAPFILSQHVARQMMEHSIRGRIVNTSTIGAHACHADRLVYDAAKGAIETMTRNMAYELGPHGITVNAVIPGAIAERPGADGDTPQWQRYARNNIPLGRVGRAEDIAATVLFFCLPEAAFISGQALLVDGAHSTWLPESTE